MIVKRGKTEILIGIILKLISLAGSIYGLLAFYSGSDWKFFTYYTNLSNIAVDIVLIWALAKDIRMLLGGKDTRNGVFYCIRYSVTVCILLTFLVFAFVLAPFIGGLVKAYSGASFGVHFLGPVFAVIDFYAMDYRYRFRIGHILWAVILPVLYFIEILILAYGFRVRWQGSMWAPYNFINFGASTGWFGFEPGRMSEYTLGIGVAYTFVLTLVLYTALAWLIGASAKALGIRRCRKNEA